MKFCDKCRKAYSDEAKFCPSCGSALIEPKRFDIFGEEIKNKSDKSVINTQEDYFTYCATHVYEILSYISIGSFLVPFIGIIISAISLIISVDMKKKNCDTKKFIIISIITLILSIAYTLLIIFSGTLERMFQETIEL